MQGSQEVILTTPTSVVGWYANVGVCVGGVMGVDTIKRITLICNWLTHFETQSPL